MTTHDLDSIVTTLERTATELRAGDLDPQGAAALVDDLARQASEAGAELDPRARAGAAPPRPAPPGPASRRGARPPGAGRRSAARPRRAARLRLLTTTQAPPY